MTSEEMREKLNSIDDAVTVLECLERQLRRLAEARESGKSVRIVVDLGTTSDVISAVSRTDLIDFASATLELQAKKLRRDIEAALSPATQQKGQ